MTPPFPTSPIPLPTTSSSKGVVTIEEFGDYQCPPCQELHAILKALKGEYGDRVQLVFYHYPLVAIHEHALAAAHAAAAAGLQGKFWEMHDLLYNNQPVWSESPDLRPIAMTFARQLGLDVARFTKDRDDPKVMELVSTDMRRAEARGVDSTPTVFIDGQLIDYDDLTAEKLREEINRRLRR